MVRDVIRYSEAFKMQVVDEVERGRFSGVTEASMAYGIRGSHTVKKWVKQYGKGHLLRKVMRVERSGEAGEINRLKARVRELETALADAHMDGALSEAFLDLLCKDQKVEKESFKKKANGRLSTRRKKFLGADRE